MVKVNVIQGENVTGRVQSVDETGVTIVPEIAVKKGMKPKQGEPRIFLSTGSVTEKSRSNSATLKKLVWNLSTMDLLRRPDGY